MNKYYVKIPYSYIQYADLSGFVYAESSEEAEELAADDWNIHDPEHNDNDSSGDFEFHYDSISVQLEESDIDVHEIPARVAFVTGYVSTDVNGDNTADLYDITLTYNNSVNFVLVRKPV